LGTALEEPRLGNRAWGPRLGTVFGDPRLGTVLGAHDQMSIVWHSRLDVHGPSAHGPTLTDQRSRPQHSRSRFTGQRSRPNSHGPAFTASYTSHATRTSTCCLCGSTPCCVYRHTLFNSFCCWLAQLRLRLFRILAVGVWNWWRKGSTPLVLYTTTPSATTLGVLPTHA
jgi:hypothetical protein